VFWYQAPGNPGSGLVWAPGRIAGKPAGRQPSTRAAFGKAVQRHELLQANSAMEYGGDQVKSTSAQTGVNVRRMRPALGVKFYITYFECLTRPAERKSP
jgi:hypothetical protein